MKDNILYKLTFPDNCFYYGITTRTLENRIKQHKENRNVKSKENMCLGISYIPTYRYPNEKEEKPYYLIQQAFQKHKDCKGEIIFKSKYKILINLLEFLYIKFNYKNNNCLNLKVPPLRSIFKSFILKSLKFKKSM
jgi:hypothetical protein